MEPYIEVIDNFFKNPDEIRSMALDLQFFRIYHRYYNFQKPLLVRPVFLT